MKKYQILITKKAKKDIDQLSKKLKEKLRNILCEVICNNPYQGKKLRRKLLGYYSYRLSIKDRILYSIDEGNLIIFLVRARTHYGG